MRRVRVALGPYDVLIGRGVLTHPDLKRCLGPQPHGLVISSEKVMRLHGGGLLEALATAGLAHPEVLILRDGEGAKTTAEWSRCIRTMAKARLERSSFVIAFGGGSIGDAAGFAAAAYMRGIRFIQIPTTLLSMVDSSVGGKTGINIAEGKNLVGAFHQPSLVLADTAFLRTLPPRERQSGVYEILKCGLLRSEPLLKLVERTGGLRRASEADIQTAIAAAVRIKARIVERDERESGERILLNLGHTLGHALEAATSYRLFTHGEAVGYGMEFVADLSESRGLLSEAEAVRIRKAIRGVGRRKGLGRQMVTPALRAALTDKKRVGAKLREVLLAGPQKPRVVDIEVETFAAEAGRWLRKRARG